MNPAAPTASTTARIGKDWHLFVPKLVSALREGYGLADLRADLIAGLTVAIVALPLAMALAIASGTTPDKGLLTAVVAGFLISALGGSRHQIGGPTGAFVVVVFNVIQQFGFDGLVLATLMAGAMLIVAGLARLGTWIKYIPEPVVMGFTAGIGIIIFTSQVKDLFGLAIDKVPADFIDKLETFWQAHQSASIATMALAAASLTAILLLRRFAPRLPGFLAVVVSASLIAALFALPVDTIGSRFGGIPSGIALPELPAISLVRLRELLPSAFTIAFLAGVESLLSAVIADGMTGRHHRSNCELVAQGVANMASGLIGGIPATGAIARTATNIRAGARTPVAGIAHAAFLLLFMLVAAPLAYYVPLASLAAVLSIVAWNMSEIQRIRYLMRAPWGDRLVLLLTLSLTVLVDLTLAIQVGVVLAAILFMHRMSQAVAIGAPGASPGGPGHGLIEFDEDDLADPAARQARRHHVKREELPPGVETFQVRGPLFFGVSDRLKSVIENIAGTPKVFVLRLREVPMIDSSGASRLAEFVARCKRNGTAMILTGLQPQPREILAQMGLLDGPPVHEVENFAAALALAREMIDSRGQS